MRLRMGCTLLLLLCACASTPRSMPRPHTFAPTPPPGPRIRLVSAPLEPVRHGPRIGKAELDQARALLSRARTELKPRQWDSLERQLTAAEQSFERFSTAARASGRAAEVVRGAEGVAQAGRVGTVAGALSRVGPALSALVLLWPASTAGPESDSGPRRAEDQPELEFRLREVSEAARRLLVELEAQPRAAKAPTWVPAPQHQPATALIEEDDPRCKPIPVPHLGGNDLHNKCADGIPNNSFPGWDVLVNGKNFDALQLATRTLWDVKTDDFERQPIRSRKFFVRMKLPELRREARLARECGYEFIIGVRSAAHQAMLFEEDPTLKVSIMD